MGKFTENKKTPVIITIKTGEKEERNIPKLTETKKTC